MTQVVVQIEGCGAFRMTPEDAYRCMVFELALQNSHSPAAHDVYITNAIGVWAPSHDEWILWEQH